LPSGSTASAFRPAIRPFKITSPNASAVNGVCGAGSESPGNRGQRGGRSCGRRGSVENEWGDGEDWADGERCTSPQRPSLPSVSPAEDSRAQPYSLLGGGFESDNGAVYLNARQTHRLAASATINCAKAPLCSMSAAATSSRISRRFQRAMRACDASWPRRDHGLARIGAGSHGDPPHQPLVPRRPHLQRFAVRPLFARTAEIRFAYPAASSWLLPLLFRFPTLLMYRRGMVGI